LSAIKKIAKLSTLYSLHRPRAPQCTALQTDWQRDG